MKKKQKISKASSFGQRVALVLFGVLLALAMLEMGLQASGFFIRAVQQYKNWATLKTGGSYRILCVGESTTQAQYPRFLEKILNARQTQTRFSVTDEGLIATNTDVIFEKMESNIRKYKPDMVVAMIGINDAGAKHMPAGFATCNRSFAQSFKTHRLMQLLCAHIQAKFEEIKRMVMGKPRSEAPVAASRDDVYYLKLGMRLQAQGKEHEARSTFCQAVTLNPLNTDAFFRWMFQCKPKEQEAMLQAMVEKFKKIFTACPEENPYAGYLLGQLNTVHKNVEAESLLKVLRSHCHAGWISYYSGEIAAAQGRYEEAIANYKESIELSHQSDYRPYFGLAYVYRALGKSKLSDDYLAQGHALAPQGYESMTVENYRKIKKLLDEHGIRLVCVQYPMRDIEPLRRIFSADHGQNVSFVDNEKLFKDALKKYRFEEIFRDRFAADFGHCTDLGNTILAGNIAKVILRDILGIPVSEEAFSR
ncbi:MAG: hypothetical protein V1882_04500 [Candidatus Omnitrophota bacterium]